MGKAPLLPLPEPFTANAAVRHLYKAWTNRGRIHKGSIPLRNPTMVAALFGLWLRDHPGESQREACGYLEGIGYWRLVRDAPSLEFAGTLQFSRHPSSVTRVICVGKIVYRRKRETC